MGSDGRTITILIQHLSFRGGNRPLSLDWRPSCESKRYPDSNEHFVMIKSPCMSRLGLEGGGSPGGCFVPGKLRGRTLGSINLKRIKFQEWSSSS